MENIQGILVPVKGRVLIGGAHSFDDIVMEGTGFSGLVLNCSKSA